MIKYAFLGILISIGSQAEQLAVDCSARLQNLTTSRTSKAESYILYLIDKNYLTEATVQKAITNDFVEPEAFEFRGLNESQKLSLFHGLKAAFMDPLLKAEWFKLQSKIKEKLGLKNEEQKKVEEVKVITKELSRLELVHSPIAWHVADKTEVYNKRNILNLFERTDDLSYFDFESKKVRSYANPEAVEFKKNHYIETNINGSKVVYYYDRLRKTMVVSVDSEIKELTPKFGNNSSVLLYDGVAGKIPIFSDNGFVYYFDTSLNEFVSIPQLSYTNYTIASDGETTFLISPVMLGNERKLKVTNLKTNKFVAYVPLGNSFLNEILTVGGVIKSEVLYQGAYHGLISTSEGLKLLNFKTWKLIDVGQTLNNVLSIHNMKDGKTLVMTRTNNKNMRLEIYDFNTDIKPIATRFIDDTWIIGNRNYFTFKNIEYLAYYTQNNEVVITDLLDGNMITRHKLKTKYSFSPMIFNVTNNKGEPFIILKATVDGEPNEIFEVKNL